MTNTSPTENDPWSVQRLNSEVKNWIEKLGHVWIEAQITQVNMKSTWKLSYLTLRDTQHESSVNGTVGTSLIKALPTPLTSGDRVLVYGKPAFYAARGSFSLWVTDIRPLGLGDLLAKIEMLKKALTAEGLFAPELKKPLPFLPRKVGLITGKDSAAQNDVLAIATQRYPHVQFEVINTAVQGVNTVPEVVAALEKLDAQPDVDVIIIARGGGSVEDLLPFSEEALIRAVSGAHTPVISAIGHEPDTPLLDNVADVRAATPTDAAKRVVPDLEAEKQILADYRSRIGQALFAWLESEQHHLALQRSRPALASPLNAVEREEDTVENYQNRLNRGIALRLRENRLELESLTARLNTLGPSSTLQRGYAIVQQVPKDGSPPGIVTSIEQSPPGTQLHIKVSDGSIVAAGIGLERPGDTQSESAQEPETKDKD